MPERFKKIYGMNDFKIYDNFDEIARIAEKSGVSRVIRMMYKNIYRYRGRIPSSRVKNIYNKEYNRIIEDQHTVKKVNGIGLNFYVSFAYDYVMAHARPGAKVLDIGCGSGNLALALASGGLNVTGCDYGSDAIAAAKEKLGRMVVAGSADFGNFELSELSDRWDYIVMSDVVEHLSVDELKQLFSECKNLLNPHGEIVIHTPNGRMHYWNQKRVRFFDFYHFLKHIVRMCAGRDKKMAYLKDAFYDQTHINIMTPGELRRILQQQGYTQMEVIYRNDLPLLLHKIGLSGSFGLIARI